MTKQQYVTIGLLCLLCSCLSICFAFTFHNELLIAKCQVTGEYVSSSMSKTDLYEEILQRNHCLKAGFDELTDVHNVPDCTIVPMMGNIMINDDFLKYLIENREVVIFTEELAKNKYL